MREEVNSMNEQVMKIAQINLRGNVMDHGWFKSITLPNGKPYMVAIVILGEIFYWYKPTEVKDEQTSQVSYKQKFKADRLQKSYQQLADSFGFTKRQVVDACKYLKDNGYITLEFRTISVNSVPHSNVMFIEPVAEVIKNISTLYRQNEIPPTLKSDTLSRYNGRPSHDKTGDPPTLERETYTEITTENTTNKKEDDDIPRHPIPNYMQDTVYAKVLRIYQENIGDLPPIYHEEFGEFLDLLGEELMVEAIKRAAGKNKRFWRYIESTLMKWKNNQCRTLADVKALDDQQKGGGTNATHRSGYGSYSPASRSYAEEDANRRRSMPSFIKRV